MTRLQKEVKYPAAFRQTISDHTKKSFMHLFYFESGVVSCSHLRMKFTERVRARICLQCVFFDHVTGSPLNARKYGLDSTD